MAKRGRKKIHIPRAVLRVMVKKFTLGQIADKLDVCEDIVRGHLRHYGLSARPGWTLYRTRSGAVRGRRVRGYGRPKNRPRLKRSLLRELAKTMTPREIAAKLNVRDDLVRHEMRRHNIKALRRHGGNQAAFTRDQLVQLYYERDLTVAEMAAELGTTIRHVRQELDRHLIDIKKLGGQNKHDLTGRDFGLLHVLREVGRVERHVVWLCECRCGKTTSATTSMLNGGLKKSCGCLKEEHRWGRAAIDLTGQRFGRLLVKRRSGSRNGYAAWECECDCGRMTVTTSCALRRDGKTHCGCKSGRRIELATTEAVRQGEGHVAN